MKKLLFGLACAAALVGAANNIESANVVGFTSRPVTANTYYLMGVQFQKTGDASASSTFNDLISLSGINACSFDDKDDLAAQILVFDGVFYSYYYYIDDACDEKGDYVIGWADEFGDLVTDPNVLGSGFWFTAPVVSDNATILVKGEVNDSETLGVEFEAKKFAICSSPYPTAVDLQKIGVSNISPVLFDDKDDAATQILVWDGSLYTYYYYLSDAYDEKGDAVVGWADDYGDLITGDLIGEGISFWITSPNAGSLSFAR